MFNYIKSGIHLKHLSIQCNDISLCISAFGLMHLPFQTSITATPHYSYSLEV